MHHAADVKSEVEGGPEIGQSYAVLLPFAKVWRCMTRPICSSFPFQFSFFLWSKQGLFLLFTLAFVFASPCHPYLLSP